jgi:hypothetical protein
LRAGDVEVATGRTQRLDEAAHAVRDWLLAGCDLGAMYAAHVFVDQHLRALGSMSERVDRELAMLGSALRVAPDEDWAGREFTEAWIYDGPRSCWLTPGAGERLSLALLLHRTQIAQVEDLEVEIAARAIASWFGPDGSVAAVQRVAPRCEPARFAAAFERGDYLAWHWGNVLEEADSSSVLALHRPLLDRIATSDVARRFYSFTSLNRLCFSRCSLYPFDTDGLPMVHPVRDGRDVVYVIGVGDAERGRGDAREALACIERVLAAEPQPAYFGNIDDRTCDEVNAALAARGSHLRARREQHRQWMRIAVRAADGAWCEIKTERRGHLSMVPRDRDGARPADAPRVEGDTSAIVDAMERWLTSTGRPA